MMTEKSDLKRKESKQEEERRTGKLVDVTEVNGSEMVRD